MRTVLYLSLVTILVCGACVKPNGQSQLRVFNGEKADGAYPSVVQLNIVNQKGERGMCSGTFIDPQTVLTAAHCVLGSKSIQLDKRFGFDVTAATSFAHPEYGTGAGKISGFQHDLGLVRFARAVSNDFLPLHGRPKKIGEEILLVGYGMSNLNAAVGFETRNTGVKVKRTGRNRIAAFDRNVILYNGILRSDLEDNAFSGQGDSGGPILMQDAVAGVIVGHTIDIGQGQYKAYAVSTDSPGFSAFVAAARQKGIWTLPLPAPTSVAQPTAP